jgi:HEAT repeat protein
MKLGWCFPLLFPLRFLAGEPVLFIPLERGAPLAHLVALANRSAITSARTGYDDVRCEALRLLGEQPKWARVREKAIKDALLAALSAEQPQIRNAGAAALGRRGYSSEVVTLFARLEADPEPLVHFFRALKSPEKDPPVEPLRKGLYSANPAARAVCAEVVGLCRAKRLTQELKELIESDTDPGVRDQAAIALALLGARDSRDALLRLRQRGYQSPSLMRAMIELGGDEQVQGLLPLLWDRDAEIRKLVAEGLTKMPLHDRKTATLGLLATLRDSSPTVRIASAQALASFREPQAISILRETLPEARNYSVEQRTALVNAVAAFGEELSIPLLNDMLDWRFREECGLEVALAKYAHPTSGVAAWRAYVDDLEKAKTRRYLVGEYIAALQIVSACADADLLKSVQETAAATTDSEVKRRLEQVAETVARRLAKGVTEHRPLSPSPPPVPAQDTDNDGVPDLRDLYPNDSRRVEDIPRLEIKFPEKRLAAIPLRTFAPGAPEPQLITLDNDNRVGYLVAETQNDAAVYRVVSTDGLGTTREWILPNPGALAGIEKLVPMSMNARGTVVGVAMWKTEGVANGGTATNNRLPPGCGFIFEEGKLKLSAKAPFSAATLRSAFKGINQRGAISSDSRKSASAAAPTQRFVS